jgi:hypothetical protein
VVGIQAESAPWGQIRLRMRGIDEVVVGFVGGQRKVRDDGLDLGQDRPQVTVSKSNYIPQSPRVFPARANPGWVAARPFKVPLQRFVLVLRVDLFS